MEELCEDVYGRIKNDVERAENPYYLGGHCMGAAAAMYVAERILKREEFPMPRAIIASGHGSLNAEKERLSTNPIRK